MRRFLQRAAICVFAFAALSAEAGTLDTVKGRGKVVVGTIVDFLPFGLIDRDGSPAGFDVDFARSMGQALGVPVEIVQTTSPNRIPYLLSGKVDIILAGLSITPERAKTLDFSRPYAAIALSIYAPKSRKLATANDLAGLSISTGRGTVVDIALTDVAPKSARIVRFDDDASAVQAYRNGQVDAIGLADVFARELVGRGGFDEMDKKFPIRSFYVAAGFRKGDDAFRAWVDEFIAASIKDGRLTALNSKWLGVPSPDLPSDPKTLPTQ